MNHDKNCIFCKIITGEISAIKVYEDEKTFAFLDITPIHPGHTLVIPKNHVSNIYEISENDFLSVSKTVHTLSKAIKEGLKCDGINIYMNNEAPAGQVIFHSHIHIIPRFVNDGYEHWHGKRGIEEKILEEAGEKIKNNL